MEVSVVDESIAVVLRRDQALVLSDWLPRSSELGQPAPFEDQSEQRALWDLDALLESALDSAVAHDYAQQMKATRLRERDSR